jgi:hypothetical protein
MAGPGGGDGDGKLPPVDYDPLNEGAVGKILLFSSKLMTS